MKAKKLVMANGSKYYGEGFGADSQTVFELVFNTSMVGYQEIISDPSYTYQGVVMTYPLIGNYGMTDEDYESRSPSVSALIVREYNDLPSNFRYTRTLADVMSDNGIVGLSGVDTRAITRRIRDEGSQLGIITDANTPLEQALEAIKNYIVKKDAVQAVSCKKRWYSRTPNYIYNVVAIDCGMKLNIVRSLNARGCNVTIVPYNAKASEIKALCPNGVFISNGPGDPQDVPQLCETIRSLAREIPTFGICLGHQLISLAFGASTYKLKFGHRGGNHPVKNLASGKIEITSQNHSFAVDERSLEGTGLVVTHRNLLDSTVEGVRHTEYPVFSVQYHPESAPGPQDSAYLFDEFITLMQKGGVE